MTRIVDFWEDGDIKVIVPPSIIEELVDVLHRPRLRQQMIVDPQILIDFVLSEAIQVPADVTLPGASRDPKDDKFLACAVEGAADYIVTGDNDLLTLGKYQNILIVRPADFVQIIEAARSSNDV